MPQVFHRSMNPISRATVFGAVGLVAVELTVGDLMFGSLWVTEAGVARSQTAPFRHKHHVGELGLKCRDCHVTCRDCHVSAEQAASADPVTDFGNLARKLHDSPAHTLFVSGSNPASTAPQNRWAVGTWLRALRASASAPERGPQSSSAAASPVTSEKESP